LSEIETSINVRAIEVNRSAGAVISKEDGVLTTHNAKLVAESDYLKLQRRPGPKNRERGGEQCR
jgi:hypothetical protein